MVRLFPNRHLWKAPILAGFSQTWVLYYKEELSEDRGSSLCLIPGPTSCDPAHAPPIIHFGSKIERSPEWSIS